VIVCVPVLGSLWAITATTQPDLSELSPLQAQTPEYTVLAWSSLLRSHSKALDARSTIFPGASIKALGYMMDGARPIRAGQPTKSFVLLPDAGNIMHPAHRFGDQMIAVQLSDGDLIKFSPKTLVWVSGTLQSSSGDRTGSEPLYALGNARVELASKGDIDKYFRLE
jgi:hypothetical protein